MPEPSKVLLTISFMTHASFVKAFVHDMLVIFFVDGFECASFVVLDVARKFQPIPHG